MKMKPGDRNSKGQTLVTGPLGPSSTHRSQQSYGMECNHCGEKYLANGCDVHLRACPNCQGGKAGNEAP